LAQAVKTIYPNAQLSIGPSTDEGYYYDFDFKSQVTEADLPKIEAEMQKIIKANFEIKRSEISKRSAVKLMKEENEPYKEQILESIPAGETVTIYTQGEFFDICRGPHLKSTGLIKAFKLTKIAGAYWRGDSKNKMLTRIYGVCFEKKSEMEAYFTMLEEAKKRDNRKLGKELELYEIFDEGPGFPFWLPKGMILRNILIDFWRKKHREYGYKEISTPTMLDKDLWIRSGHWSHYRDNMYTTTIDDKEFAIKPMNCPGGMLVYANKVHSYRDLPERVAELGLVHRHELSGALHGLMRVRCFTQDDAHIFMTRDQIESEILGVMKLIDDVYKVFGFEYHLELSTRPANSMGSDEDWEIATNGLINALNHSGKKYTINEGDGAFYGPKIDFHLKDCIGRTWQCGTIQLDFQLPEKFELEYTDKDNTKKRPIMLHRVVYGSIERFIGILIEHYAGAFPTWLAPVQVKVINVSEKSEEYARAIEKQLFDAGVRVESDLRSEKIGYKIRQAQLEKVPFMIVVGENEVADGTISVRTRAGEETKGVKPIDFINQIKTLEKEYK
jgi:threonyl-tRNA synthetase